MTNVVNICTSIAQKYNKRSGNQACYLLTFKIKKFSQCMEKETGGILGTNNHSLTWLFIAFTVSLR